MGGFLGLVFLTATGKIIYFKQLTEANSDKARYQILYKIGVNRREVKEHCPASAVHLCFAARRHCALRCRTFCVVQASAYESCDSGRNLYGRLHLCLFDLLRCYR